MIIKEITLPFMFCCVGFFLSFFAARTVNVALLLLMVWIPLKVIEKSGLSPDWSGYYRLKDILLSLWRVLLDLLSNMLSTAPTTSMVFFVAGGLAGFLLNLRTRARA